MGALAGALVGGIGQGHWSGDWSEELAGALAGGIGSRGVSSKGISLPQLAFLVGIGLMFGK